MVYVMRTRPGTSISVPEYITREAIASFPHARFCALFWNMKFCPISIYGTWCILLYVLLYYLVPGIQYNTQNCVTNLGDKNFRLSFYET